MRPGLAFPGGWEPALQIYQFGPVMNHHIGMVRVLAHEVLVIRLRVHETTAFDFRCDRLGEDAGLAQLVDIGAGNTGLGRVLREDSRSILRSNVRALAIDLGRIGDDCKEDSQQVGIADFVRIELDPDGLPSA